MMGFGLGSKESMSITYLFLLGGSVASIYSNWGKRNKENTCNLIDEKLVVISLPMTVTGSVIGVLMHVLRLFSTTLFLSL